MKTRLAAITLAASSVSMLTACGGGGPSEDPIGDIPAPTVTIDAPAAASTGVEFIVRWSATNALSCSASFSDRSTIKESVSLTETSPGAQNYTVTCSNSKGSATAAATVAIIPATTAEGGWTGATDDNRDIGGVILAPASSGNSPYWLAYSTSNSSPSARSPAGFIVGTGLSTPTDSNDANSTTGTFSSDDLREFNFAGGRVNASGSLTSPYARRVSLGTTSAPSSFTTIDSITNPVFPLQYNVTSTVDDNPGSFEYIGLLWSSNTTSTQTGTANLASNGLLSMTVSGSVLLDIPDFGVTAHADPLAQNIQLKTTTDGSGNYNLVKTATATSPEDSYVLTTNCQEGALAVATTVCDQSSSYNLSQKSVLFDDGDSNFYSDQRFSWSGGSIKVKSAVLLARYNIRYTLTPVGSTPVTKTFSFDYVSDYESTPNVAIIAGTYSAGWTGIDATMHTTASLTVGADASITGTEPVSQCDYAGSLATHATGNLYDVTVTFSNAGGTCIYNGKTFTGVATYDATDETLTITAVNAAGNQGFMVVADK